MKNTKLLQELIENGTLKPVPDDGRQMDHFFNLRIPTGKDKWALLTISQTALDELKEYGGGIRDAEPEKPTTQKAVITMTDCPDGEIELDVKYDPEVDANTTSKAVHASMHMVKFITGGGGSNDEG